MIRNSTCNAASIAAFVPTPENPWDAHKIRHLYRRIGFGATQQMITEALAKTPAQLINQIMDEATNATPTPAPVWGYWYKDDMVANNIKSSVVTQEWKEQMVTDSLGGNLRERLVLFWSNHFVTESEQYNGAANTYQYYNLLQRHALGNFKDFVSEVGLCTAMLVYLNGNENIKGSPNENYARELYELFALGVDNGYDQTDITETARALTGYNNQEELWGPYTFDENNFDSGMKTIFGQTGNWDYDDVINILFEQHTEKIAVFICRKLYQYFIDKEANETIVAALANTFMLNNFEIAPVIKRMLRSAHFYDQASFGVIIKSPMDLLVAFNKELELTYDEYPIIRRIKNGSADLGQSLLDPINVKGWQGDTNWIASNTLVARWDLLTIFLRQAQRADETVYQTFAIGVMGGGDGTAYTDPALVSKTIIDHFLALPLADNAAEYQEALDIFKEDVPENYFEDGSWNLSLTTEVSRQVYNLLLYIIRIPEFQLK